MRAALFEADRIEPLREDARYIDGHVDQVGDLGGVLDLAEFFFLELAFEHLAHEGDPRQVLAQAVMEVAPYRCAFRR
jgi:hypothetical protein